MSQTIKPRTGAGAFAKAVADLRQKHATVDLEAGAKPNKADHDTIKNALQDDSALELAERTLVNLGAAIFPDATAAFIADSIEAGAGVGDMALMAIYGGIVDAVEAPIKGADAALSGATALVKGVSSAVDGSVAGAKALMADVITSQY